MDGQTSSEAPACYFTRVDLTDKLGERLIKLQKRREGRAKAQAQQLTEWWSEGDKQEDISEGQTSYAEEEDYVFTVGPEDRELAAQMAALGLPTLLGGGSKHEARANRRGRKSKKKATSTFLGTDSELRTPAEVDLVHLNREYEVANLQSEEPSSNSSWQPVWDADYSAFYWFNSSTQQSQWETPEGCEQSAAALYAFDQDVACDKVLSEDRKRDDSLARQEDLASLEENGNDLHCKVHSVGKAGVCSTEGTSVEAASGDTGPLLYKDSLRGMPRPCGQHIRFEEGSDAEENEERGADGGAHEEPKGEKLKIKDGSKWSAKDFVAQGFGKGIEKKKLTALERDFNGESSLESMEVDDPMEIDTIGGEDSKSRKWHVTNFTESGPLKDPRSEQTSCRAGSVSRSVEEGRGDLLLSRNEASCLGESLFEAAQERSHAQLREDEDSVFSYKARKTPVTVQQKRSATEEQQEKLDAPTSLPDAASPLVSNDSRKVNPESSLGANALAPDEPLKAPARDPPVVAVENGLHVEQVKRIASRPSPELEVALKPSARASEVEKLMTPAAVQDTALESTPMTSAGVENLMTSALAVPGAGGDAGGAVLTSSCAGGHEKPADVGQKYWFQRYRLFSKFDQGVRLDPEGWYSVTPEAIAIHHANRCKGRIVIDAFAGVGGNAIQLATTADWVIAIDMDPGRLALAEHNARVYGVRHKIELIAGDFFKLAPHLKADALFLSPPWGGPEYNLVEKYDLDTMLEPVSGVELFKAGLQITSNIALFLPRNVDTKQLQEFAWLATPPLHCEIESNYLCGKLKCVTAYYGDLVNAPTTNQ